MKHWTIALWGRHVYYLLEHSRVERLKSLLQPRTLEVLTTKRDCNKFLLAARERVSPNDALGLLLRAATSRSAARVGRARASERPCRVRHTLIQDNAIAGFEPVTRWRAGYCIHFEKTPEGATSR